MGTFLKYVFYLAVILLVYIIIVGIYNGKITKESTVSEVGSQIGIEAGNMAQSAKNKIEQQ